jgi:tetratricopeptide (TPR) repeat protein
MALLTFLVFSGCIATAPMRRQSEVATGGAGPNDDQEHILVMINGKNAPLPRQVYSSAGEKVPYVADQNPYTSDSAAIPADASMKYRAADSALSRGDLKGARTQFRAITEAYPTLSGAWVKLGYIAEKKEKYDEAVKCYTRAITVNRNNVNAYIALGLVQRRLGKFVQAQKAYLEALQVWKDFPEAHLNIAILYDLYMNSPEDAQRHYEAYDFLTHGKNSDVHKWLVEVKRRTGIEQSFIDVPPKVAAQTVPEETAGAK